jgi:hypothetical protein
VARCHSCPPLKTTPSSTMPVVTLTERSGLKDRQQPTGGIRMLDLPSADCGALQNSACSLCQLLGRLVPPEKLPSKDVLQYRRSTFRCVNVTESLAYQRSIESELYNTDISMSDPATCISSTDGIPSQSRCLLRPPTEYRCLPRGSTH